VVSFGSSKENLFAKSMKNNNNSINKAQKRINKMSANLGGT
jgi:hypothetical protein